MSETTTNEPKIEIKPEYKGIVDKIRATYQKNGADLFHEPEEYGVNQYHGKTQDGSIRLSFDYGAAQDLETPDGGIVVLGSHGANYDGDQVMKDLKQDLGANFDITVVKPKRNDAELRKAPHGELEFQLQNSGPIWELTPKKK